MKTNPNVLAGLACLPAILILASCSSTAEPPPPAEVTTAATYEAGVPGGVVVNTLEVSATVAAIDYTTRKVTLLGPDGKKFKVKVGPDAINFNQIKAGDAVNATVTEELVVFVGDETDAQADGAVAVVALAPKGAPPGGVAAETVQVTGTVTAIDQQKQTATIRFEDGTAQTFPVRSDIDLTRHKVGQKVVFQVTGMVALRVEKP